MQNITIEERVVLLEIQVTDLEQNVSDLDQDVNFLFDEQVIQDERLFQLETETEGIEEEVEGLFVLTFSHFNPFINVSHSIPLVIATAIIAK